MPKPTFVCVPGVSHSPLIFNPLKSELSSYGYEVIPLALPSVGARPVTYDFTEDVHTIRYIVSQLVESERDVIVVMHAYGGIPGSEALYGLGKLDRERRGLKGGVVRLVFIMSWMVKEGFQASARGDVSTMSPYMLCDLKVGITTIDPSQAVKIFYNDLPPNEAEYYASQLQPQSVGVFWSKTTYAAWRYIPTTYVLCGQDQFLTLPYAEMILKAAGDSKPNMIDTVEKCEPAGHSVMLSQVSWTANMLRRAAGERA